MKNVDYIVVGLGLAGVCFCEHLIKKKKSFVVFADRSQQASLVAGGTFNPVVLKRFTAVKNGAKQLDYLVPFYRSIEERLGISFLQEMPIYRKFNAVEEQNNWFIASDKPTLKEFLSTSLVDLKNEYLKSDLDYGEVMKTGRIDTQVLLNAYEEDLLSSQRLLIANFDHHELSNINNSWQYNGFQVSNIVFAEGYGMMKNPFFNQLPLVGNKGEYIVIEAPELKIDYTVKGGVFLISIGACYYKVGATYDREVLDNFPTVAARDEIKKKLDKMIGCDYKVVDQVAGVRPTVKDRRPLVGKHPKLDGLFLLNGLGTRGVMIAPTVARALYDFIDSKIPLDADIDCSRYL